MPANLSFPYQDSERRTFGAHQTVPWAIQEINNYDGLDN